MAAPTHLRAEHLGRAVLGLGEPRPRLSWQLPDGTSRQVASALELNGVDLGRTESDELRAGSLAGRAGAFTPAGAAGG